MFSFNCIHLTTRYDLVSFVLYLITCYKYEGLSWKFVAPFSLYWEFMLCALYPKCYFINFYVCTKQARALFLCFLLLLATWSYLFLLRIGYLNHKFLDLLSTYANSDLILWLLSLNEQVNHQKKKKYFNLHGMHHLRRCGGEDVG